MKEMEWTLRAAEQARVRLTEEETARLAGEMRSLLVASGTWSESAMDCDLDHAVLEETSLRADEIGESLPAAVLLSAAGEKTERFFSVPRAVEERSDG